MNGPQVSVISAWYNRPEDLAASVRSVLDQAEVELEYIVIDDASNDGETWPALQAIKDPRLRLERNEANVGFTRSMRRAAALARGEFIAVHDAGDISRPGRLSSQAAFLRAHPGHVAVGCRVENRDMVTGEVSLYRPDAAPGRRHPAYTHGEVMFRRAAYGAVGGYRDLFYYAQDRDLWHRLAERGALGMLDDVLYERRVFADGIAGNLGRSIAQAIFANLGIVAAEARLAGVPDPVERRGALALLEQQPTPWFEGRVSERLKRLVKARRWRAARQTMDLIPAGMMTAKMRLLYLALRLVTPRWQ